MLMCRNCGHSSESHVRETRDKEPVLRSFSCPHCTECYPKHKIESDAEMIFKQQLEKYGE
jgi:hypothetical protein